MSTFFSRSCYFCVSETKFKVDVKPKLIYKISFFRTISFNKLCQYYEINICIVKLDVYT